MVLAHALPRIAVALEGMSICLKLCAIRVIPSTRRCVRGQESTLTQNSFPCKRSTQPSLFFNRAAFSHMHRDNQDSSTWVKGAQIRHCKRIERVHQCFLLAFLRDVLNTSYLCNS